MEYYIGYMICGIVIVLAILISLVAQINVNSNFDRYKNTLSSIDLTGRELAERLALENGLDVSVKSCNGKLTDHYNPTDKSLNISHLNYISKSISAQAIVAHEFGHALQHSENYAPFKLRQAVIKTSNFLSRLLLPMIIIGLLFELFFFAGVGNIIIYAYVGIYAISVIANLVTLPVEYNASARAKKLLLEMGADSEEEVKATDRLLNSAAMTYVASLLVSVAFLMRILYLLAMIKRR
jgi:hypothetical protein